MTSPEPAQPAALPRSRPERAVLIIGSLGPLGYLPASGTATVALVGLPLYWATRGLPLSVYLVSLCVMTLVAIWIHHRGDALLSSKDSSILVWDEIVGFMVAVTALPFTWKLAVVAFFFERALDILKVWPARWIENHWPGGWGVVGDDIVAGLYTLGVMHAIFIFRPGWLL